MKPVIVGLNLLHLLVENRLAEFHSEVSRAFEKVRIFEFSLGIVLQLEHLNDADKTNPLIAYPIVLEEWLMEGSYNKVSAVSS